MSTLRQVIERDRALRKIQKPGRMLVAVGNRFKEGGTGDKVFWCSNCSAAVVDSTRARERHAQRKPECLQAMGME